MRFQSLRPSTDGMRVRLDRVLPERRQLLVESATERSGRTGRGLDRLRARGWPVVQTALAAGLAWVVAKYLLGHPQPFFAPVAAIVSLGVTRGERGRQALEMMLGLAMGIAVADLLVTVTGIGPAQVVLIVGLSMAAAVLVGRGQLFATQAAVSAALVATIDAKAEGFVPDRFFDGLVGGSIALLFSQVLFPVDPVRLVREIIDEVLAELAGTLEAVAEALEQRDLEAAEEALARARRVSGRWSGFEEAVQLGRESARFAPPRRGRRDHFELYEEAGHPIDLIVRDVQVLARGAARALRIGDPVPPQLPVAVRDLAEAMRGVASHLKEPGDKQRLGESAREAAGRASAVLDRDENVSVSMIVGHVQATAVDALRSLGVERVEAHDEIGAVARAAQFDREWDEDAERIAQGQSGDQATRTE
jgi:uncharacterized membrane protein YccC